MDMTEETKERVDCGEYRLEREIGRGAYGVVYLAEGQDGGLVAVKVCRRDDIGEERYERELRGAKLYSEIPPQEGLVPMFEIVEEPWGFYAVMGLADDEFDRESPKVESYRPKTLANVIDGEKALPLKECVELGIALAKGLAALQRHHLLHRDIKPGNVLFFEGRPVLSDPGLVVEESVAVSSVGTPGYLPPERKFTDPAGDIYCLGLTLKAASFGRPVEDLYKGPAAEADTGAALFPAWWRILNKATEEKRSMRYQSAKAFIKDLKSLHMKMGKPSARRAWVLKAAAALALIGLVAITVSSLIGTRDIGLDDFRVNDIPSTAGQLQHQRKLEKFIQDASGFFLEAVKASTSAYTVSRRMSKELSRKIEKTTDRNEAEKLSRTQTELLELNKKLREISVKICMVSIKHNDSISGLRGPSRRIVEEKIQTVLKLLKEGEVSQVQTWKIGTVIYGKEWKPPSQSLHDTPDGSMDALSIQDEARKRIDI